MPEAADESPSASSGRGLYRARLRGLDAVSTAPPWVAQGEFYGVVWGGRFRPIGFAPHHALDPVLIAEFRNSVRDVVTALDAVQRLAQRAAGGSAAGAGVSIMQILEILDGELIAGEPRTARLRRLDRSTTQPLWDPGHLALGIDILQHLDGVDPLRAAAADPHLIAAARSAIPRTLDLLEGVASAVLTGARRDGGLAVDAATTIVRAIEAFDDHRVDEGSGTGRI